MLMIAPFPLRRLAAPIVALCRLVMPLAVGLSLVGPATVAQGAQPPADARGQTLREAPLSIASRSGKRAFTVEVALDEGERNTGLMYRREMADGHGMLFLFPASRPVSFWMMNTYLPLDLLFIDGRGTITGIAANAKPMSLDILNSPGPVVAVLEINGGLAARLGIGVGDSVDYPSELRGKAR